MTVIEEHYLDLEEATAADTGVYICRVSDTGSEATKGQGASLSTTSKP